MENVLYTENLIINNETYDMSVIKRIDGIDGVKAILSKNSENLFDATIKVDRNELMNYIKEEGNSPMNGIFQNLKALLISKVSNWKIINEANL